MDNLISEIFERINNITLDIIEIKEISFENKIHHFDQLQYYSKPVVLHL